MVTKFVFLALSLWCFQGSVEGHGMMLDPCNRASLWRFDKSFPADYSDNQYYCGGKTVQFDQNGGKCGECGDNWADPKPRHNENTGTYGTGYITTTYTSGQIAPIFVNLTANHVGKFTFSLCKLEDDSRAEEEECFFPLTMEDGTDGYNVINMDREVHNNVKLPAGFTCDHCVLRWNYRSGNTWGDCGDGTSALGCGPQETFRSCADVKIV